jgi:hypothetical protein
MWTVFGAVSLTDISEERQIPDVILWIITILMFGNAGLMLVTGWGLNYGIQWFYSLSLAVIGVNIILTFTDQVGLFDWLTLVLDLILLALLLMIRKDFILQKNKPKKDLA